MATAIINLEGLDGYSVTGATRLESTQTTDVSLLISGWSVRVDSAGSPPDSFYSSDLSITPTGDASWVPSSNISIRSSLVATSGVNWCRIIFTGPPNTDFTLDAFATYSLGDRIAEVRVNGSASQNINSAPSGVPNDSVTLNFSGTTDGSGEATLEFRRFSAGNAPLTSLRLSTPDGPSVSLGTTTYTPGSTISGSYANFAGVPTSPLVLTDSGSNTLNVTVTITDNGDGTGTFTGTMPSLPAQGASAAGLLFGSVTASLIDPDTTAPVLTTATVTSPAAGQIDGTVDTDEADGTLYYVATLNATETLATVKAGSSQSVIATGTQTVSVTGLAAGTYYMHFAHTDQAGNDSAVLTSASVVVA